MMRFAAAWSPARLTDSTTASLPLRKPKAEKARERVMKDFSREREVDEIVALYRRLWGECGA